MSPAACGSKPVSATGNDARSTLSGADCATAVAVSSASTTNSVAATPRSARRIAASEQLFDVGRDRRRLDVRRVALDDPALAVDKELGEVPLDRFGPEEPRLRLLQEHVQRRRV